MEVSEQNKQMEENKQPEANEEENRQNWSMEEKVTVAVRIVQLMCIAGKLFGAIIDDKLSNGALYDFLRTADGAALTILYSVCYCLIVFFIGQLVIWFAEM